MCAWESFPKVCRGTELLGILQTGQVTFSKLDVHHKSIWGAVPPIQFSGASHPECPQPCSFFLSRCNNMGKAIIAFSFWQLLMKTLILMLVSGDYSTMTFRGKSEISLWQDCLYLHSSNWNQALVPAMGQSLAWPTTQDRPGKRYILAAEAAETPSSARPAIMEEGVEWSCEPSHESSLILKVKI